MGLIQSDVDSDVTQKRGSLGSPTKGKRTALEVAGVAATRLAASTVQQGAIIALRELEKATGLRFDAAPTYLFFVEISGLLVALFTECKGLKVERKVEKVKEGGVNYVTRYLPGRLEFDKIVLRRGISLSRQLWDWFMHGQYDFRVMRRHCSIIQGAPGHNMLANIIGAAGGADLQGKITGGGFGKVKHWDLENAYPVRWEMSDLNTSQGNSFVIETLEFVHEGISLSYEVLTPLSPAQMIAGSIIKAVEDKIATDAAAAEKKPISEVVLEGPDTLETGERGTFVARVSPSDAATPITYTWVSSPASPSPAPSTGSNTAQLQWDTAGEVTVSVTAENSENSQDAELTVTVEEPGCEPVTGVSVTGQTGVKKGVDTTLTASAIPSTATTPITYKWSPAPTTGPDNTNSAIYNWPDAGTYQVTVTVTNACGEVVREIEVDVGD